MVGTPWNRQQIGNSKPTKTNGGFFVLFIEGLLITTIGDISLFLFGDISLFEESLITTIVIQLAKLQMKF